VGDSILHVKIEEGRVVVALWEVLCVGEHFLVSEELIGLVVYGSGPLAKEALGHGGHEKSWIWVMGV